ncbi:inner membrane protein yihy, formerly thought to be rnase bn [hydrocarbon metagenome]|uniref:Inner membrane protein yihy, formerly thought to be rnase bn n=1 Tax=hydrocarbon metagenome TaxID=938273 RepID=A0A0W8FS30_9ZZZZ
MAKENKNKSFFARCSESIRIKAAGIRDILADALKNYRINGDVNQAAAMALYTILSIIPLFLLTIIAAGYYFSSYPNISEDIIGAIKAFHPYFSEKLLTQLAQIERKKHLLGWAGVLGLIGLSSMIFNAMETALNIIFRSRKKRNYFVSKLLALSMIPMGWIVGSVSLVISDVATLLVKQSVEIAEGFNISLGVISGALLRYAVPYFITVIFFYFIYRIIPADKIRSGVALAGSALFALLMEVAKQFFTWYIANYTRYDIIFGTLGTIVIVVIWAFYVALIFLFCAELMSSYQRRDIILLERAMLGSGKSRMKVNERLFNKFGRVYEKDSILFNEGDSGKDMFYVLSGRVCLEKVSCQIKKVLTEIGPGQYFGEMAALIESTRTASARALEDCHLAVIDSNTFINLVRESSEVSILMFKEFSRRLKDSNMALDELTNLWTRMIVIIYFVDNAPVKVEEHLPKLALFTKKNSAEIREIINELARQDIFVMGDGLIIKVVKEKMWSLLDSGALRKCFIDDADMA